MANNSRPRRAAPSQFKLMVEFISRNPYLITRVLSNKLTSLVRNSLWEELTTTLNQESENFGAKKSVHQWRRAWTDLKAEVRVKLTEQERRRKEGIKDEILVIPYHKKVAKLLKKAVAEEKRISELERIDENDVKYESEVSDSDNDNTPSPFVVSVVASSKNTNQVKSEWTEGNNSSDSEGSAIFPEYLYSEEGKAGGDIFAQRTMPLYGKMDPKPKIKKRHRRKEDDDLHLDNLVQVEREKADMLQAIGSALSLSNEIKERKLKAEEDRNKLIEERNFIENERNEILKSLLEHFLSK